MADRRLVWVLFLIGCGDGATAIVTSTPEILFSDVAANPNNVLSLVVSLNARHADSVAVQYGISGSSALIGRTPAQALQSDSLTLAVLGLRPETRYDLQVVAYGGGKTIVGSTMTRTTGALPADLPVYHANGSAPTPGYVVFAADPYGIVIDNAGSVVWYRRFPNGPGLNFQVQSGRYLTRPPPSDPTVTANWLELDALGNVVRTLGCAGDLQPRFHDLLLETDGSYWIMCDETRAMDLTGYGGVAGARVTGTVIQHVSASKTLLLQWSPFDHFAITDLQASDRVGAFVNWTHGNALAFAADGNLLVSFRSLNEITKIDVRTAATMWRMGGARSDFTFNGSPTPPFARQHGLRAVATNQFVILDNSGDPTASSGKRYTFDEQARTAHITASYASSPGVIAQLGGNVQDLPGGHTLVSFGNGGRVEEYDANGTVVWRLNDPGYVFRAQRIQSLYQPGVGLPR